MSFRLDHYSLCFDAPLQPKSSSIFSPSILCQVRYHISTNVITNLGSKIAAHLGPPARTFCQLSCPSPWAAAKPSQCNFLPTYNIYPKQERSQIYDLPCQKSCWELITQRAHILARGKGERRGEVFKPFELSSYTSRGLNWEIMAILGNISKMIQCLKSTQNYSFCIAYVFVFSILALKLRVFGLNCVIFNQQKVVVKWLAEYKDLCFVPTCESNCIEIKVVPVVQ